METHNGFSYYKDALGRFVIAQGANKALDAHMERADWGNQDCAYWDQHWNIEERIYRRERAKADKVYFDNLTKEILGL